MADHPIKLPLFPLSSIVMPDGLLPLRLFEPRYLQMVSNCLKTEQGFGVCLIREGGEAGTPASPYPLGTLVKIIDFDQGSDGLLHITAQGEQEFTLHDFSVQEAGLLMGNVTLLERHAPREISLDYTDLSDKLSLILDHLEPHISFEKRRLDDAEWVSNRLLELLPIDAAAKYDMLKTLDLEKRLEALDALEFTVARE